METGPLLQGLPGGFAFPLTRPRRGKSPGSLESERRRGMCRRHFGLLCAPAWARGASPELGAEGELDAKAHVYLG